MEPAPEDSTRSASRQMRRYGPVAFILVLIIGIGAFVAFGNSDDGDQAATSTTEPDAGAKPGAPAPTGQMPVTYAEADAQGKASSTEWGDHCDTTTGNIELPSVYASPCVPAFEGDNGGATATGVTDDTIRIVRYQAQEGGDLTSLLSSAGVEETNADQHQTFLDYLELHSSVAEQYGRKFEVIDYQGTGAFDDEVASRADANQIIEQYKPFAVVGAPALDNGAFAQELAHNKILCIGCGVALPDKTIEDDAPYLWGPQPSPNQLLTSLAAWVNVAPGSTSGESAAEAKAVFAGDPAMRGQQRKVAVLHFEQNPPVFEATAKSLPGELAEQYSLRETYQFNLASMPEKASELIAKFKQQGITTVMFLGDPVMPIYLTKEATKQDYQPEWIFTGTALTDTNVFGRLYDQTQMAHAFGLSNLAAPTVQDLQDPWRVYKWYFGADAEPAAPTQYAVIEPSAKLLVDGVHMAGPDLTAETFARGLFRIPPAGGGPTNPQVSFGNWGFFDGTDYMGIDDSVEIWWDPDAVGTDEINRSGKGMWRRSNGGTRFTAGDVPTPEPFVEEGSVLQFDHYPAEDTPPEYPPPPGSPAAGG